MGGASYVKNINNELKKRAKKSPAIIAGLFYIEA
jgi:hypothetical protein